MYLKFGKRVDFKCFHHTYTQRKLCEMLDALADLIVVIISQCVYITTHHVVTLKGKVAQWKSPDPSRPHGLYNPWNSPGQNTGVGSLSLLQGVFPTQGSNQGLLHCRQILYQLSHKGSPRTMELVPIPSPEDLPNPGIEQGSPSLQVDSLLTELSKKCTLNIYKFICHLHFNQARKEKKDTISLY